MSDNLATYFSGLSLGKLPRTTLGQKKERKRAYVAAADDTDTSTTSTQSAGVSPQGVAVALWNNSGTPLISTFEACWTVPPAPPDDGETYYLYNCLGWALTDKDGNVTSSANLRPVLRWAKPETGGSACWSVSSWYLGQNSTCSTTPVVVNTGSSITGKIKITKSSTGDSEYDYKCFFTNSSGEISGTQLYVYGGTAYTTAIMGFEWNNVTDEKQFPSSAIVASSIVIKTGDTNPSVTWTLKTSQTTSYADQVTVKVDDASSTSGKVEFDLPKPSS